MKLTVIGLLCFYQAPYCVLYKSNFYKNSLKTNCKPVKYNDVPNVAEMPDNDKMSLCTISSMVTHKSDKYNNSEELLSATNSDSESGGFDNKQV